MKFITNSIIIVLLAITCQEICAKDYEAFMEITKQCQAEYNLSDYDIDDIKKVFEDSSADKNFKCFTHCVLKNLEVLDDNDKLDEEKLLTSSEKMANNADTITDCKAAHDLTDDPCEYSFEMLTCLMA